MSRRFMSLDRWKYLHVMREDKRCLLFEAGEGAERPGTDLRLRVPDGVETWGWEHQSLIVTGRKPVYDGKTIIGTAETWGFVEEHVLDKNGFLSVDRLQGILDTYEPDVIVKRQEGEVVSSIATVTVRWRLSEELPFYFFDSACHYLWAEGF